MRASIWDASSGKLLVRIPHKDVISDIAFSADGTRLASAAGMRASIWDASSGELLTSTQHSKKVVRIAFSSDGTRLASASEENQIKVSDAFSGRVLSTLSPCGSTSAFSRLFFSPDGSRLLAGGSNGVQMWDAASGAPLSPLPAAKLFAFSPDGKQRLAIAEYTSVQVQDTRSGQPLGRFAREPLAAATFSPDRKRLVTIDRLGNVRLWDAVSREGSKLPAQSGKIKYSSIAYSPDGLRFATGSSNGSAQIWDAASRNPLSALLGDGETVTRIAFSSNGKLVATVSHSGLRLWDAHSGSEVVLPFPIHDREGIYNAAFSPDGKRLATVGRRISFWDTASGKRLPDLSVNEAAPNWGVSVAFSPDGKRLATLTPREVRFWDYSVPEKPRLSGGGTTSSSDPQGGVFSPDGNWLAFPDRLSRSGNDVVRVWDVASGREGFSLFGQTGRVVTVAFSRDGTQIYAVADDGTLYTHPTRIRDLMTKARGLYSDPLLTSDCSTFHLQATGPCQAASLVDDGRQRARDDDIEKARADFQEANKLDPFLQLDPQVEAAKFLTEGAEKLARDGKLQASIAQFQEAIKLDPTVKLDPQSEAKKLMAQSAIAVGREKASSADIQGATAQFQEAIKLDPTLKLLDLQTRANQLAAPHFVQIGAELANKGDVAGAAAQFEKAMKLDPSLGIDPQTKAKELAIQFWVLSSMELVREGKVAEAVDSFKKAQTIDSTAIAADSWNDFCYLGSVQRHPDEVMFACDQALKLNPNNWHYLDSRGLARALIGNSKGAIQDFDAFIARTQNQDEKAQRQHWVRILRKGQRLSFTDDEIKQLLTQ